MKAFQCLANLFSRGLTAFPFQNKGLLFWPKFLMCQEICCFVTSPCNSTKEREKSTLSWRYIHCLTHSQCIFSKPGYSPAGCAINIRPGLVLCVDRTVQLLPCKPYLPVSLGSRPEIHHDMVWVGTIMHVLQVLLDHCHVTPRWHHTKASFSTIWSKETVYFLCNRKWQLSQLAMVKGREQQTHASFRFQAQ